MVWWIRPFPVHLPQSGVLWLRYWPGRKQWCYWCSRLDFDVCVHVYVPNTHLIAYRSWATLVLFSLPVYTRPIFLHLTFTPSLNLLQVSTLPWWKLCIVTLVRHLPFLSFHCILSFLWFLLLLSKAGYYCLPPLADLSICILWLHLMITSHLSLMSSSVNSIISISLSLHVKSFNSLTSVASLWILFAFYCMVFLVWSSHCFSLLV